MTVGVIVVRFLPLQAPMKFKVDVNILSVEDVPGKAERVVVAVVRLSHTHTHTHTYTHKSMDAESREKLVHVVSMQWR